MSNPSRTGARRISDLRHKSEAGRRVALVKLDGNRSRQRGRTLNGTTSANPAAVARDVRDSGEARLMMSEARRGTAVRHTATSPETAHKGSFALGPLQGGTVRKACDSDSLSVRACSRLPRRPGKRALPLLLTGSSPAFGAETHRVECCNGRTGGNRGMHARGPHHAARESDALARQELARPSSTTRAVQWPSGPPAGRGDHLRAPAARANRQKPSEPPRRSMGGVWHHEDGTAQCGGNPPSPSGSQPGHQIGRYLGLPQVN